MQNMIGRPKVRMPRYNESPKCQHHGNDYADQSVNEEAMESGETEEDELPEPSVLSESAIAYQQYLPKRIRGAGCAIAVSESLSKGVPVAVPPVPVHAQSPQPTERKVRLTTEIRESLHDRLRIHGIRVKKTNIQIIEGWIENHCPE